MKNLRKTVLIFSIIGLLSSCTGIGVGIGVPIGPVSLNLGTTLRMPRKKNKVEKVYKSSDNVDISEENIQEE